MQTSKELLQEVIHRQNDFLLIVARILRSKPDIDTVVTWMLSYTSFG